MKADNQLLLHLLLLYLYVIHSIFTGCSFYCYSIIPVSSLKKESLEGKGEMGDGCYILIINRPRSTFLEWETWGTK